MKKNIEGFTQHPFYGCFIKNRGHNETHVDSKDGFHYLKNGAGFTIIEVFIAIILSVLIAGGIFGIYVYSERTFLKINSQVYANRDIRLAIEQIMRVARNANRYSLIYNGNNEALVIRWDNHIPMSLNVNDDVTSAFYYNEGANIETSAISYNANLNSAVPLVTLATGVQAVNAGRIFTNSIDNKTIFINFKVSKRHLSIPYQNASVNTSIDLRND